MTSTKSIVEWDGKDFRGQQCTPNLVKFMRENPKVFDCFKARPKNSLQHACTVCQKFMEFNNLTIDEWLAMDKKTARDKVWEYIDSVRIKHPATARVIQQYLISLYLYHNEEKLVFLKGKHDIAYEPKRLKQDMDKGICWKIIGKAKNVRDEAILTFAFESGVRENVFTHMTFGHFQNFHWFKKTEDGSVQKSDMEDGDIAIFKIMARPTPDYTHDHKLRGKGINWYYGCLHKEATKILKEFVAKHHEDSKDDKAFWYSMKSWKSKNKSISPQMLIHILKDCVKRAGLDCTKINFHALRRGFRHVVRNTAAITDAEFKEAIMGHKLKGSQEAYFDKNPLEFAREYAKCDFSLPSPEKDKLLDEKQKEIDRLTKQIKEFNEAIEEAKLTTKVEIKPLGHEVSRTEITKLFNEFNESLNQPSEPIKTKPITPIQVTQTRPETPKNEYWIACPDDTWVTKAQCDICRTTNYKKFSNCTFERYQHPDGPLFQISKPKLMEVKYT